MLTPKHIAACAAVVALSIAAVIATAPTLAQNATGGKPTAASQVVWPTTLPARQFNSKLALEVWVCPDLAERHSHDKKLGQTPMKEPLEIPACQGWEVEPLAPFKLPELVAEMNDQHIPGLSLPSDTSDADLAKAAEVKELQLLDIDATQVTDAGLAELKKLKNLRTLNLEVTQIGDPGLEQIAQIETLERLNLQQTRVTDAGLMHLTSLKNLRLVLLGGTQVTDTAVAKLQAALPACRIEK